MIQVLRHGIRTVGGNYRYKQAIQQRFYFALMIEGAATVRVGVKTKRVRKGMIYYLPKGIQDVEVSAEDESGFSGLYAVVDQKSAPAGTVPLICIAPQSLLVDGEELKGELQGDGGLLYNFAEPLLQVLVGKALRHYHAALGIANTMVEPDEWVEIAKQRISLNIHSNFTLNQILAPLPISPRQLRRHFHHQVGHTIKEYQLNLKLDEAAEMLQTNLSITHVAIELGFCTSQHFSTMFKRKFGLSPKDYQASNALNFIK